MTDVVHDRQFLDELPEDLHQVPREILLKTWPEENCIPNLEAYRENLLGIGFRYVRVEDITEVSYSAFHRYLDRQAEAQFAESDDVQLLRERMKLPGKTNPWCMVYAIK